MIPEEIMIRLTPDATTGGFLNGLLTGCDHGSAVMATRMGTACVLA